MFRLGALVVLSLISGSQAGCSSSYQASYDLSTTASTLSTPSPVFSGGNYYIAPCASVDTSLCPYTSGSQACFATTTWELVADGLGSSDQSTWTSYNGDWANGAVSTNVDVTADYDQCNADPSSSNVQITYLCNKGDDSIKVDQEPSADKDGACAFKFTVDSAVVCAASGAGGGGGGSGTGGGGGNHGGGDESKKGLSGGWIFVIILLVGFTVYLLGGMAWNHFRGGKTGKEMLPNREFWAGLPSLVKDGCGYFIGKCRGLCSGGAVKETSSSYSTM